jgi:hypothetical protein
LVFVVVNGCLTWLLFLGNFSSRSFEFTRICSQSILQKP